VLYKTLDPFGQPFEVKHDVHRGSNYLGPFGRDFRIGSANWSEWTESYQAAWLLRVAEQWLQFSLLASDSARYEAAMSRNQNQDRDLVSSEQIAVDSEQRVNLIRISAIAAFYFVHLWHVSAPRLGEKAAALIGFDPTHPVSANVHINVTVLCLAWLMQAFAFHFFIQQRRVSDRLVILGSVGDVGWLTAILCLSSGPGGPLVAGYFLIIMLTGLRFNLRLVRITTVASVVGYLVLLGVARWPGGMLKELATGTVPRYHQVMILLALVISGVIMGQIVRRAYGIAETLQITIKGPK
jgi:hypothetical protein